MNSNEYFFLLIRRSLVRAQVEEPNKKSLCIYAGAFFFGLIHLGYLLYPIKHVKEAHFLSVTQQRTSSLIPIPYSALTIGSTVVCNCNVVKLHLRAAQLPMLGRAAFDALTPHLK